MKNINIKKQERVEVMALFGYEMTPCQPLSFRRKGGKKVEVTDLLQARIKFVGTTAIHIFDVMVGRERCCLEFDSSELTWHLT